MRAECLLFDQVDYHNRVVRAQHGENSESVLVMAGYCGVAWRKVELPVFDIYQNQEGKIVPVTAIGRLPAMETGEADDSGVEVVGTGGTRVTSVYYRDIQGFEFADLDGLRAFSRDFVARSGQAAIPEPEPAPAPV